jgi:tRNA1Val (adenine37-N6)-methyltransferase
LEKFSADNFLDPGIKLSQPENGYRFSFDPFILAAHVKVAGKKKIIDIGSGCGIISLLLAFKYPDSKITGVEIQKELYLCARKNIITNKLENIINIIHGDIKDIQHLDINGKVDIIVSNPPYKKRGSGRLNPGSQKAIARHEIFLDIDMLFKYSSRLLKEKGKLYLIFPASRLSDLFTAMNNYYFTPGFTRFVHIKKKDPAKLIILSVVKNSSQPCIVHPPFYIYTDDNKFSNEYISIFSNCGQNV